jgi:RNA polymerase sigma-70 factor (ECF subfamily)
VEPILQRIARGERAAVRACYDEYTGLIWSIARRMTRTRADAEDAVQDVFVEIWRSAPRFDPAQGTEKVFITTIARRRLIDRLRRVRRGSSLDVPLEPDELADPAPHNEGELRCDAERAAWVVARLRPEQSRVLRMGLLEGMTHSEIAAATGLPLGTVKTLMRRGLIQVRAWLRIEPLGRLHPAAT